MISKSISMEMIQNIFQMKQPDIHESVIFRRVFQDRMAMVCRLCTATWVNCSSAILDKAIAGCNRGGKYLPADNLPAGIRVRNSV